MESIYGKSNTLLLALIIGDTANSIKKICKKTNKQNRDGAVTKTQAKTQQLKHGLSAKQRRIENANIITKSKKTTYQSNNCRRRNLQVNRLLLKRIKLTYKINLKSVKIHFGLLHGLKKTL